MLLQIFTALSEYVHATVTISYCRTLTSHANVSCKLETLPESVHGGTIEHSETARAGLALSQEWHAKDA